MKKDNIFQEWLHTRPPIIQHIARIYPPGQYRIKRGAPYGVSCPGTIVEMYSYYENGNVGVVVRASEKMPEALVHERRLQEQYGNPEPYHGCDFKVEINPIWLEPVEN